MDEWGTLEEHWGGSLMPGLLPSNGYSVAHLASCRRGEKNVDKSCHFVSQTYLGGYMEWKIVKIFQSVLKLFLLIQL